MDNLRQRYLRLLEPPTDIDSAVCAKLSPPILVEPGDAWTRSHHRLMVVGQESFGWDYKDPSSQRSGAGISCISYLTQCRANASHLTSLLNLYEAFDLAENTPSARSPFWRAHRHLASRLENGKYRAVLWSNLVRVCCFREGVHSASPVRHLDQSDLQKLIAWQSGVLADEVCAFDVGAVIFFTGPFYDEFIASEFPGAAFRPVEGIDQFSERQLARVEHDRLPPHTYRTYHPGYLCRSRKWGVIDNLCDLISGGGP